MARTLTPLALGILSTLRDRPMHPYELRQTMLDRKHDRVVRMPGGSIYSTIDRLLVDELIVVVDVQREGRRPERTVYDITPDGEAALLDWLRTSLGTPGVDFPQLASVIAFLPHLMPVEAAALLTQRKSALEQRLADEAETMTDAFWGRMPRIFHLHGDYTVALWQAELDWVTALILDIETGRLTWPPMIVSWHERRGTWQSELTFAPATDSSREGL